MLLQVGWEVAVPRGGDGGEGEQRSHNCVVLTFIVIQNNESCSKMSMKLALPSAESTAWDVSLRVEIDVA